MSLRCDAASGFTATYRSSAYGDPDQASDQAGLEAVGLVKAEDVELPTKDLFGKDTGNTVKVRNYALTEAAKSYLQEREVEVIFFSDGKKAKETQLYWGKKALNEVVKWEGPMKTGDYQEARVTYTYKIDKMADWAKGADVQAWFPGVRKTIEDAGKRNDTHAVKLTSEDWQARGLDSRI